MGRESVPSAPGPGRCPRWLALLLPAAAALSALALLAAAGRGDSKRAHTRWLASWGAVGHSAAERTLSSKKEKCESDNCDEFWITGEPKSGTNWFTVVVAAILKQYPKENASCHYSLGKEDRLQTHHLHCPGREVVVNPHSKHLIAHTGWHYKNFDWGTPPQVDDEHMREEVAKQLEVGNKQIRQSWLVIFRDPRSVINSACHHVRGDREPGGCDKFTKEKIAAQTLFTNLRYRFFKEVIEQTGRDGALPRASITFYEGLKENFTSEVRALATQLKVPLSAQGVDAIRQQFYSIEQLRGQMKQTRSGAECGFKDELGEAAVSVLNRTMRKLLLPELSDYFTQC